MARKRNGVLYGLLAASLAVNFAGAGYLGVAELRPKPPRTVESTIGFVSGRYPAAMRDAVKAKLEARRSDLERALGEMKAARRATRDAMSATPLDTAKVGAAFAEARAKTDDFQKIVHGAIVEALPGVPEAELAKIDRGEAD
ncbi:MAG: periplasmic heavy metal sensor [Hansschlegelia sp.]